MNLGLIATVGKAVATTAARVGISVNRHSPEILVGAGIIGGTATTVMACRATLKVNAICVEANENYAKVDAVIENENVSEEVYSNEDAVQDRKIIMTTVVSGVVKNYGPVMLLGAASITSILCGYNILNKRNMALVAAYATLDSGFKAYRGRVIAEQGEEADWRYRTGSVMKKVEKEVIDEKTGEVKMKKVKAEVLEEDVEPIDYTINFCREAIHIRDRMDVTGSLNYIQNVENSANTVLLAEHVVTLNDVRTWLGCPINSTGQIVGWTMDGSGDNYVELKTHIVYDETLGHDTIIIDPNVEGPVFHKIDRAYEELRNASNKALTEETDD